MDQENRVVVLVDMDCFYCQVEEKLNPDLAGKPIAVVQYNPWKGGGIIAVNYVARAMGVTRHMRGDEAKEKCPEIELPSVPCQRGKADITKYRDAGKEVVKVLQKFTPLLERASIDEAYLDITAAVQERLNIVNVNTITSNLMPNTFALGYDSLDEFISEIHAGCSDSIDFDYDHARRLLMGAVIVSEMRAAVFEETGYRCSAGIAHNKILAKLVCGMNKPDKQTVLPKHAVNILYKTLPLKKVKHLGGKFGDSVREILRINTMAELQQFSEKVLQTKFDEKNGTWLYNMARGINLEPVQARFNPKSIGCCKQLRGKAAVITLDGLRKWLKDLGDEIEDRLEKDALENNRTPKQMVVSFSTQMPNAQDSSSSRSYNFTADDDLCGQLFFSKALDLLMESTEGVKVKDDEENRKLKAPIKFLGISVGKFEDNTESKKIKKIKDFFNAGALKPVAPKSKDTIKENKHDNKRNDGKEYVLRKFFQTSSVPLQDNTKDKKTNTDNDSEKDNDSKKDKPIESALDKQESFFAKFLTGKKTSNVQTVNQSNYVETVKDSNVANRSATPECNVVQCGEDSNDTDYSASTINLEINKSIALFEEDPEDVSRVSSMRQLLNSSKMIDTENTSETTNENEVQCEDGEKPEVSPPKSEKQTHVMNDAVETIECPECRKTITFDMLDIHADYHVALKLRNEEKLLVRQERENTKVVKDDTNHKEVSIIKVPTIKPSEQKDVLVERIPSITNFFVKLDDTVPVENCAECGKKVPVEQFTEHLDFHEAQKLNRLLNKKSNPVSLMSSTGKRKRKSTSPVKKPKVPCKPIHLFFR